MLSRQYLTEVQAVALDEVDDATRGAHCHVNAAPEVTDLSPDVSPCQSQLC